MSPLILALFSRYWKQLAIAGIVISLLTGVYLKGRRDCASQMEREVATELQKRTEAVQRERTKTDKIRDNVKIDREAHPIDDERDTCLLSNNPYRVDCLKKGGKK